MSRIQNLVIFMSDGVRWDSHPSRVRERGVTYRTIASSSHTPTAIASMLTGQYLGGHQIRGFTDVLSSDTTTILDAFDNCGISSFSGNFNNEIYSYLLQRFDERPLTEMEEPFCWFMRDPGGHAPYGMFDEKSRSTESVDSYLKSHAGDNEHMRSDYQAGVSSSVERFEEHVLETLRERGIESETLVVFISDHGQLLGEYGHVGESYPVAPEVVYVPTTFIHPALESRESDQLFRHIDLPDTVAGYLDTPVDPGRTDGIDQTADEASVTHGLCLYDRPYPSVKGSFHYTLQSAWDWDGGHVFNESSFWEKTKLLIGFLMRIPAGRQLRSSRSYEGLKYLFSSQYSWGEPDFDLETAREFITEARLDESERRKLDLDKEAKENLENLGYL